MISKIRKITVNIEETHIEIGQSISPATRKAVAVAVIENPFAGVYQDDLSILMDIGAELGALLGKKCVNALGITPAQAEGTGAPVSATSVREDTPPVATALEGSQGGHPPRRCKPTKPAPC